jgi:environmental stress-induced protein Ves
LNKGHITAPEEFIPMPWRNGLGSTIELAKHPSGDAFKWRLSMADVAQDGTFSDFSGYDRCLLLMRGAGMTLTNHEGQQWELSTPLDAAHFRGEDLIAARLHNGPIRDLNLITRRQDCWAKVFTSQQHQSQTIPLQGDLFLLFSIQGNTHFQLNNTQQTQVQEQHLLQLGPSAADTYHCHGEAWVGILISDL